MQWCPSCSTEFVNKKKTCTDCGTKLVNEEPEVEEPEFTFLETEFIASASSEIEANMLISFLESNGINTMRKYREAGGYLTVFMGDTSFGVDIYADKEKAVIAKELIEQVTAATEEQDESLVEKKPKWLRRIFIIVCIILFLF